MAVQVLPKPAAGGIKQKFKGAVNDTGNAVYGVAILAAAVGLVALGIAAAKRRGFLSSASSSPASWFGGSQ